MRSGVSFILIGVVLCACATAAEQPAQFSRGDILIAASGDPNEGVPPAGSDPNRTWDPASHLAADWEYVSVNMTSQIYNPAVQPDVALQSPQWAMSLSGIIDIIDSNGLIGWAQSPSSVKAYDQNGQLIASSTTDSSLVRWYQQPMSWHLPDNFPTWMKLNRVSLNLPVEPDVAYPDVLSSVEWTMNVLVADEAKTVDIPFQASDTWVELTPGMEILVEQATAEQGKYQYRIQLRYDPAQVDCLTSGMVSLWRDEALPAAAVLKMDVVNAQGESVRSGSGGSSSSSSTSGSSTQRIRITTGTGTCDTCGDAAFFRYTLVSDLYELGATFVLTGVPVPEF
jgi:hypothetical protein